MASITAPTWTTGLEVKEATLANLALYRIGVDPIKDTTEDTPQSRAAKAVFAATRDELLRNGDFNFAKKNATAAEGWEEDTAFVGKGTFDHAYIVPTATVILKVVMVGNNKENKFEVVGSGSERRVITNILSTGGDPNLLDVQYIEQVTDPDLFDPMFKDALVLRIASKLAVQIIKSAQMAQFLQSEFSAIFSQASMVSAQEANLDTGEPFITERGTRQ